MLILCKLDKKYPSPKISYLQLTRSPNFKVKFQVSFSINRKSRDSQWVREGESIKNQNWWYFKRGIKRTAGIKRCLIVLLPKIKKYFSVVLENDFSNKLLKSLTIFYYISSACASSTGAHIKCNATIAHDLFVEIDKQHSKQTTNRERKEKTCCVALARILVKLGVRWWNFLLLLWSIFFRFWWNFSFFFNSQSKFKIYIDVMHNIKMVSLKIFFINYDTNLPHLSFMWSHVIKILYFQLELQWHYEFLCRVHKQQIA